MSVFLWGFMVINGGKARVCYAGMLSALPRSAFLSRPSAAIPFQEEDRLRPWNTAGVLRPRATHDLKWGSVQMRSVCRRTASFVLVLTAAFMVTSAHADWETKKLQALLSATETKGEGGGSWTLSWNFDGQWQTPMAGRNLNVTVDSDYSKSDTAKLDRLRTGFRLLDREYGKQIRKWHPVYLIQTEGDHSLDSIHTLGAAGYRQKRRYGFVELTAGASKDVTTGESWVGDIGAEVGYERNLGPKWKFRTGPTGEYGALGSVRLRDDRFRYSWDVSLDYQASKKLGLGYRMWYGNTVPGSRRTQWIGLTYKLK